MNVTILTDASYDHRYKIGGYGYWIACARGKRAGEGVLRGAVVNSLQAEMMAVCRALYDGVKLRLIEPGDEVLVQTDCQTAIDVFTGHCKSIKDALVTGVLDELKNTHQLKVTFRHVKGHTRHLDARFAANRACDARAKAAMRAERDKRKMPEARVAWLKDAK